jgi:O-antigen biosynthesis protein WbqV
MLDMGAPIKIGDLVDRIIRLRGLRAGKDIEIVYTGLRPGEKLTEDLVFDVEQVEPTDCSAIYRVVDAWRPSLPQLEDAVDVLLQVATQGDHGAIRSELAAAADGQSLESAHARRLDSVG